MKVHASIEKIQGGFIIEQKGIKRFYKSLEYFVYSQIIEDIKEVDKDHRVSDTYGNEYILDFNLSSNDLKNEL